MVSGGSERYLRLGGAVGSDGVSTAPFPPLFRTLRIPPSMQCMYGTGTEVDQPSLRSSSMNACSTMVRIPERRESRSLRHCRRVPRV